MNKKYSGLICIAPLVLTACATSDPNSNGELEELVVVSWGGSGTEAQREHWYEPFTEETGIEIVEVSPPEPAQLRAQVDSDSVEWDLVLLDGANIDAINADNEYLEDIPYEEIDAEVLAGMDDNALRDDGFPAYYWGWAMVYHEEAFDQPPETWGDFWDLDAYPGARTMPDQPRATSEAALLSLGFEADELYPLDLDEALERLTEIDGEISSYWDAGAAGVQMLVDGEADLGMVYATQAAPLINEGAPLEIEWNQGIYAMDYFTVPSGQMSEEAISFLEFIGDPERQANYASITGGGPTHEDAFDYVDPEMEEHMVTYPDNIAQMIEYDSEGFWGPVRDEVEETWTEWKLDQ